MSKVGILLLVILIPVFASGQEPGMFRIEQPEPKAPPPPQEALRSRGLTAYEVMGLHVNRIGCARRLYTRDARSIEGDADLKVTQITQDLMEAELPSYYRVGGAVIESVSQRQLLNVRRWKDGRPLKLTKTVTVTGDGEKTGPQSLLAVDEVHVLDGVYPLTYLIRETVFTKTPINVYFLCQ